MTSVSNVKVRKYIPICLVQFIVAFEFSIVNVAIPQIQNTFGINLDLSHWLLSSYAISFASFLILGGRLTDRLGARRSLVSSLWAFIIFSALAAISTNFFGLLTCRVFQGLCAAVAAPAAMRIITETTTGSVRAQLLSWWGASASFGFAFGIVAGGILSFTVSWDGIFWACSVIACLLVLSIDKSFSGQIDGRSVDFRGAIFLFAGSSMSVASISLLSNASVKTSLILALSSVPIWWLFYKSEHFSKQPIFPAGFLKKKAILLANGYSLLAVLSGGSMVYFVSEYAFRILGWSELTIGFSLIPDAIAAALGAKIAIISLSKYGTRMSLLLGFLSLMIGMFGLAYLPNKPLLTLIQLIASTSLVGFGLVLVAVITSIWAASELSSNDHGVSAGLLNATQQWGLAIGLTALIIVSQHPIISPWHLDDQSLRAFWYGGIIGCIACLSLMPKFKSLSNETPI